MDIMLGKIDVKSAIMKFSLGPSRATLFDFGATAARSCRGQLPPPVRLEEQYCFIFILMLLRLSILMHSLSHHKVR